MFKFSNRSLHNLEGLHPKLIEFAKELLKISPYDFTITHGIRTAKEQNSLYQQGRTKPGKRVTNCDGYNKKSNHQVHADGLGYAFDIAVIVNKKYNWNPKYYKEIGAVASELMKKYKVTWGGNWTSFKDYPHFQYSGR